MKHAFFPILLFIFINHHFITAQESDHGRIGKVGITYSSLGDNIVYRFEELEGAASYEGDYFNTFGISYTHALNKWLEAETGIEYSLHKIIIIPNLGPDVDYSPQKANLSLINIPVTIRANFLKYFFVNGGLILDIDASMNSPVDNQTGIGTLLGLAVKYDFNSGISAFVNPYFKIHSLIPFTEWENHQRIWENGFRFGLTYNFGN